MREEPADNLMAAISWPWYNCSYTMAAQPIKSLELHYTMTQFLIKEYRPYENCYQLILLNNTTPNIHSNQRALIRKKIKFPIPKLTLHWTFQASSIRFQVILPHTILAKNSRDSTQNCIVSEHFHSAYLKPVFDIFIKLSLQFLESPLPPKQC